MLKRFCNCINPSRPVGGLFVNWNDVDNTCPLFSLVGQEHNAKVVDVYDGDSIKIVIKLSGSFQKFNCRLADIDTPELRSKNMNEKLYAHYVKKKVENDLLNKIIKVKCGKFDKYGRLLIWIFLEGLPDHHTAIYNQYIIKNKWGIQYDGKTKKLWSVHLENNPQLMRRHGVIP